MSAPVKVLAKGKTKTSKNREVILVASTLVGTPLLQHFLPSRMLFGMTNDEVINDQDLSWADAGTNEESLPPQNTAPTFQAIEILPCNINDDMSFATAFSTARQELGAGAIFEWHGKVYNTFYESEWADLGEEGRANFLAAINYSNQYYNSNDPNIEEDIDIVIEDESDDEQPIELIVVDEIDEDDPIHLITDEDEDEPILLGTVEQNNNPQEYNHISNDIPDLDINSDDINHLVNHTDISNTEDISDFV